MVCGLFGLRFYVGAPLITPDGYMIGTVCVVDTKPRTFSEHQRKILKGMAKLVMEQIEVRLSNLLDSEKLGAENKEQHEVNDELLRSQDQLRITVARLAQSENRFQNLVRDATLGIVVLTGEEMLVEIVNESYARIVSRLLSELQNKPLFNLIPETEAEFRPLLENVKHTGTPLYLYDTPYFVFHFIRMVSHELKTPLTSLNDLIHAVSYKLQDSEDLLLRGAMKKANTQIKRMSNMINGFLNISRLESGQMLIEKRPFDIVQLIQEIIEESFLTLNSQITFTNHGHIEVYADYDKIGSVVSYFLSNAIKYSPKEKQIVVTCVINGQFMTLSVPDRGWH